MDLDGPAALYRWPDWLAHDRQEVLHPAKTEKLLDLPFGHHAEHPEAIVLWPRGRARTALVLCDSPTESRQDESENSITADLFCLPKM